MELFRAIVKGTIVLASLCAGVGAYTVPGSTPTGNLVGVPIGGIGSGIFNVPPSGVYNTGMSLASSPVNAYGDVRIFTINGTNKFTGDLKNGNGMNSTFTGLWPRARFIFQHASLPVDVALDIFSAMSPGNDTMASMPAAFWAVTVTNRQTQALTVSISFVNGANTGVVREGTAIVGMTGPSLYDLVANDGDAVVTTGGEYTAFSNAGDLDNSSPGGGKAQIASRIALAAGQTRTVAFICAWDNANAYYRKFFANAQAVARFAFDNRARIKADLDGWQNKILNSNLPNWYKDILINNCHAINALSSWNSNGVYAMTEGPYGIGCIDQQYHGSMVLPIFAPAAAASEVGRMAAAQLSDGCIPHFYENSAETMAENTAKFILMALRNYRWTGSLDALSAVYPQIKKGTDWIIRCDTDNDGLSNSNARTTYDNSGDWLFPEILYVCELNLAAIKAAAAMARIMNEPAVSQQYEDYFTKSSASFEKPAGQGGFWDSTHANIKGRKGYYVGSTDVSNPRTYGVWESQLAGQWYAYFLGLGELHPHNRIQNSVRFTADVNIQDNCFFITRYADTSQYFLGDQSCQWPNYPAGHFAGPAISCGLSDIGLCAIRKLYNAYYIRDPSVWAQSVKATRDGVGVGWGAHIRYCNNAGVFSTLFCFAGLAVDARSKTMRIEPNPALDSIGDTLKALPIILPAGCGILDYWEEGNQGVITVRFDKPYQVDTLIVRRPSSASPAVTRNGSPVAITSVAVGNECKITFGSTFQIDNSGVVIRAGASGLPPVEARRPGQARSAAKPSNTIEQTAGMLHIKTDRSLRGTLTDATGRTIRCIRIDAHEKEATISTHDISAGIVLVRVGDDKGFFETQKIVVRK